MQATQPSTANRNLRPVQHDKIKSHPPSTSRPRVGRYVWQKQQLYAEATPNSTLELQTYATVGSRVLLLDKRIDELGQQCVAANRTLWKSRFCWSSMRITPKDSFQVLPVSRAVAICVLQIGALVVVGMRVYMLCAAPVVPHVLPLTHRSHEGSVLPTHHVMPLCCPMCC